jgi:hypothetical protein
MPQQQRNKKLYQEGQLLLAMQALKSNQIQSIRAAARLYNVPRQTLSDRVNGRVARHDQRANRHILTTTEEEALKAWILDMDSRGYPLTIASTRSAANLLLQARCGPEVTVGTNWPSRYISRTPDLKSQYTRAYDAQRAKCEDPVLIQGWFNLVRNTIAKYGIASEDIYNFDETGFAMGIATSSRVVTSADRRNKPKQLQPGDREWATVIEAIGAAGWALPPMVILKGKVHMSIWYEHSNVPDDWLIALSPTGWTNDDLGIMWLQRVFDPYTRQKTVGTHRLLILDGHGSHATPQFDQYCREHAIITLCMPPHSSHILQPLDVGCFSALKRAYSRHVVAYMQMGINHIDKAEFLPTLRAARCEALTSSNIQSGFASTGLYPFNPEQVLCTISRPLTPPEPPAASQALWTPETPHNTQQLAAQVALLKNLLRRRSRSPTSPSNRALNQLVKGCEMAMHSAVLLAAENERLRTANERQQRKRQLKRRFISKESALSAAEAASLIRGPQEPHEAADNGVEDAALPTQTTPIATEEAIITCYICRGYDHIAVDCLKYK